MHMSTMVWPILHQHRSDGEDIGMAEESSIVPTLSCHHPIIHQSEASAVCPPGAFASSSVATMGSPAVPTPCYPRSYNSGESFLSVAPFISDPRPAYRAQYHRVSVLESLSCYE